MTKSMSDVKNTLEKGTKYRGFLVTDVYELSDYHATAVHLLHEKTGLEVLHLLSTEEENLFAFCFRTPNKKGNGTAHIMEHSVLCGSKKYPLKDPFTQLSNQSVKTYLNAATYADKTVYPASSTVEADYFNLMSVYADAVFFPKLSREIFAQEAHRLEIDKEGRPSIQGVVYNEMKGVYSSFESVAMDVPVRTLLKDSIYGKDSGGDPLEIPSLTYEEYLEFHNKWYRPENCMVFLSGNIPTKKQLAFLQKNLLDELEKKAESLWTSDVKEKLLKEYLSCVKTPLNKEPLSVSTTGPSGEENEKGSTVYVTWNLGPSKNAFEKIEKVFLTGVLIKQDSSPLQKALVDSSLGEDTAPGMGLDTFYNTLFTTGLRGVKKQNVCKVQDVIFETLKNIADKGISQEDIDSTLMSFEFGYREIKRSRGPFSLVIMQDPVNAWLYGYDIKKSFRLRCEMEKVKEKILKNKGYLEKLIKKYLLENPSYAVSVITPSKKYTKDRDAQEKKIIEALLSKTTPAKVADENEKLHEYQSKKDDASCLPHLSPKDFLRKGKRISDDCSLKIKKLSLDSGVKIDYLVSEENTNGITYLDLAYPVDVLSPQDYLYLPLFSDVVCNLGWGNMDWSETCTLSSMHTGGYSANLLTNENTDTPLSREFIKKHTFTGRDWIVFKLRVLDEKLEKGLEILADNINLVDFHESKRIKDIVMESRNDFDSSVVYSGQQYALMRALRKQSRVSAVDEIWNGITQLFALHKFASVRPEENAKVFDRIFKEIKAGGALIHITAEKETIEKSSEIIKAFAKKINLTPLKEKRFAQDADFIALTELEGQKKSDGEVLVIPGQTGFASQSFRTFPYGVKGNGIMEICTHWLSNILLWEKIRTIGGAYGAYCDFESTTGNVLFATYRDPTPEKSNSVFEKCLKDAAETDFSQDEVEKAVMGTYSHFVVPKTPRSRGSTAFIRTLYAIMDEDRETKMLEMLNCNREQLMEGFKNLSVFSNTDKNRVIIGSENCTKSGKKVILPL